MILSNVKTGEWVRVKSMAEAYQRARKLGWVDFEVRENTDEDTVDKNPKRR